MDIYATNPADRRTLQQIRLSNGGKEVNNIISIIIQKMKVMDGKSRPV